MASNSEIVIVEPPCLFDLSTLDRTGCLHYEEITIEKLRQLASECNDTKNGDLADKTSIPDQTWLNEEQQLS